MKPFTTILLAISVSGLVLGLLDVGGSMFSGVARALGAVFFILVFICRLFEKIEAEQNPAPAPIAKVSHGPKH